MTALWTFYSFESVKLEILHKSKIGNRKNKIFQKFELTKLKQNIKIFLGDYNVF